MTEREEIIERLRDLRKNTIDLSRICKVVIDKHDMFWTIEEFLELRDKLIDLLSTGRENEWYEEHESYLEEHGWYQALDADKEPIKFGDDVEWRHTCGSCELCHGIVMGIKTDKIDDEVFHEITVKVDRFTTVRLMANQLRHYHAPTVEDVLHEFICDHEEGVRDEADLIAEYAAKLRLAGDAE